ncbi:MAG: sugar ABC transporter ATP-binding protein [Chloroflexi bacterium]|nr:sugar ABC transporter ATP-binding protein [Chloroflexota bacterium]
MAGDAVAADSAALLELRGMTKSFPGVQALVEVDLDVRAGQVHAVVGENGAGKSTLMKIVAGVYRPDAGSMRLAGEPIAIETPRQAHEHGISMIHQELNLAPNLSVAENIFLGRAPTRGGLIDSRSLYAAADALVARLGIQLDVRAQVEDLSVARQQMVEIAKALSLDARIIIMDEPTSALTERETESLFDIIGRLKQQGVAVVYISHRLDEIFRVADRVTVLRDGRLVGSLPIGEATQARLINMMVGRELTTLFPKQTVEVGAPVLEVRQLRRIGELHDISFVLRKGEILGLAGLVGAGRTELVRVLFGADPLDGGQILIEGRPVEIRSPRDAIRLGLGFVTEDRKLQGLVLGMTVRENATLASLSRVARLGFLNLRRERALTAQLVDQLGVRTPGVEQVVENLSGGNQQKVVIAKWLATSPRILILDEPTRGIDVGAKAEVHALMSRLVQEGVSILMISSELPEILGMSDRVLVMRQGRISGEFTREQASQEAILACAA